MLIFTFGSLALSFLMLPSFEDCFCYGNDKLSVNRAITVAVGASPVIRINVTSPLNATDVRITLGSLYFKTVRIRPAEISVSDNVVNIYDSRVDVSYQSGRSNSIVTILVSFHEIQKADNDLTITFTETSGDRHSFTMVVKYCNVKHFEPNANSVNSPKTCGFQCAENFRCNPPYLMSTFVARCSKNAVWNVTDVPCTRMRRCMVPVVCDGVPGWADIEDLTRKEANKRLSKFLHDELKELWEIHDVAKQRIEKLKVEISFAAAVSQISANAASTTTSLQSGTTAVSTSESPQPSSLDSTAAPLATTLADVLSSPRTSDASDDVIATSSTLAAGILERSTVSGGYMLQTFSARGLYSNAKMFCHMRGGWPAEPRTKELNLALQSLLQPGWIDQTCRSNTFGYFIGLRYYEGNWRWESDGMVVNYTNWVDGFAMGTHEHYAAITKAGKWTTTWGEDVDPIGNQCSCTHKFSCQYEAESSMYTPGYFFVPSREIVLYDRANDLCSKRGGWLAEPKDRDTYEALIDILSSRWTYYVGLRYSDGKWIWKDNKELNYSSWNLADIKDRSWLPPSDSDSSKACVVILRSGEWKSVSCTTKKRYICQFRDLPRMKFPYSRYYEAFSDKRTYSEAEAFCETRNGEIAQPYRNTENGHLTPALDISYEGGYYIGLTYKTSTGHWTWNSYGEDYDPDWAPGMGVNETDRPHAVIVTGGKWHNVNGTFPRRYACQYEWLSGATTSDSGGYYYIPFVHHEVYFNDAISVCTADGGQLAEPTNEDRNTPLKGIHPGDGSYYYIGLRYVNGSWRWNSGAKTTFTNWPTVEESMAPVNNDSDLSCAAFDSSGFWRSVYCDPVNSKARPLRYYCQYVGNCGARGTCRNGGSCSPQYYDSFKKLCTCYSNYYQGDTCEIPLCDDPRFADACHTGTCIQIDGSNCPHYKCDCTGTGYKGPTCAGCQRRLTAFNQYSSQKCPLSCGDVALDDSIAVWCLKRGCNCSYGVVSSSLPDSCDHCILPMGQNCSEIRNRGLEVTRVADNFIPTYIVSKQSIVLCHKNNSAEDNREESFATSCPEVCQQMIQKEILLNGSVSKIAIDRIGMITAYCECSENDINELPPTTGWIVIQRRIDNTSFDYDKASYEMGFGSTNGSYWLGLTNIYTLARRAYPAKLQINLMTSDNRTYFIRFNSFSIDERHGMRVREAKVFSANGTELTDIYRSKMITRALWTEAMRNTEFQKRSGSGDCSSESFWWWVQGGSDYYCSLHGHYTIPSDTTSPRGVAWYDPNGGVTNYKFTEIKICPQYWDC